MLNLDSVITDESTQTARQLVIVKNLTGENALA